MRWCKALLFALVLAGLLGCPHAFRKGGAIDKAAEKDLKVWLEKGQCPPPERVRAICDDEDEVECFEGCSR